MEELMEITIHCMEGVFVKGKRLGIGMVPFTGEASGPYFTGTVVGTGVDTQRITEDGGFSLSARYMLEGEDHTGQHCRIFIENNGDDMAHCHPTVVTDSDALSFWEDGVKVHLYRAG